MEPATGPDANESLVVRCRFDGRERQETRGQTVSQYYLMAFPGLFSEVFVADGLDRISISFLVDEMRKVRGAREETGRPSQQACRRSR
ncbi:MAG: hypothetical protein DIJKHBIC_01101 [Thermoanaerobaculia bacterium]|nr:hypothetical protein [Thermoanaerobaculia bacterium]